VRTRQKQGTNCLIHHFEDGVELQLKFRPDQRIEALLAVEKWHVNGVIADDLRALFRMIVTSETWEPAA
jgi:hypothetical protein